MLTIKAMVKKDGMRVDRKYNVKLEFLQVLLQPFHRLHTERNITVHRAKLAAVMGAALRDLDERPCGPVGIAVNGICKMHNSFPFFLISTAKVR